MFIAIDMTEVREKVRGHFMTPIMYLKFKPRFTKYCVNTQVIVPHWSFSPAIKRMSPCNFKSINSPNWWEVDQLPI